MPKSKLLSELESLPSFNVVKNLLIKQVDENSDAIIDLMPDKHHCEYDKYDNRYHQYDISDSERYDAAKDELLSGIAGEGWRYSLIEENLEDVANFIYAIAKEVLK